MTNAILNFAKEQVKRINELRGGELPVFNVGDTVSVKYKITEDSNVRIQAFVGVVIAKTKAQSNYCSTFTVRKISDGIGAERKFMTYSPLVSAVDVVRRGVVRRAKLYYLRNMTGKSAKIEEKRDQVVA